MKPSLFAFLGGALLVSAANAQFGRGQTSPRFGRQDVAPSPTSVPSTPTSESEVRTFTSTPLRPRPISTATSSLPLQDVVLFSSGVGYFGRSGPVAGDATVDLLVRAPQISDILKSLVLFDPKGHVDPVTYSIEDYLAARPNTPDLNIDPDASPGTILRLLQGAQVRIERPKGTIEGRVISVSSKEVEHDDVEKTVEYATLLTANGIATVSLDDVVSFTPLDRGLADKFAASLQKKAVGLTQGLDDGVRPITLHFRGKGTRDVRAGYLLESPAWKTSYRLVLDPKSKPYLQGWAVVENPGDEDWKNVNLSLVSGRPISFVQDMVTPIYIVRPVAPPQVIGSPNPQTFSAGLDANGAVQASVGGTLLGNERRQTALENRQAAPPFPNIPGDMPMIGGGFGGVRNAPGLANSAAARALGLPMQQESQAIGVQQGNLFVYSIDTKVSIPHGQAAMVPIISENVDGEAVTILQSQNVVGPLGAQNGFRLQNRSDLNLQGGPITVYSDGVYGGDALTTNISPGEVRLIAYAVDLDMVARLESAPQKSEVTAISATKGVLNVNTRYTRTQNYVFRNKSDATKIVILQQPEENGWQLVDAKQLYEKSNDGLRFRIEVPAGKTVNYALNWQRPLSETITVWDLGVETLGFYTRQSEVSPALKAKLLALIELRKKASGLMTQREAQEKALQEISDGQTRIRENMKALDRTSPLYKSYEAKLMAQETQVDKIQSEIDRLTAAENAVKQAVTDAIAALAG